MSACIVAYSMVGACLNFGKRSLEQAKIIEDEWY